MYWLASHAGQGRERGGGREQGKGGNQRGRRGERRIV